MEQEFRREPRVRQSVAFRRDQLEGLRSVALKERHGNVSLIVQRAVDRELERCDADVPKVVEQEASAA